MRLSHATLYQAPDTRTHPGLLWKHVEAARLEKSVLPGSDVRAPFPVARHSYPGMKALSERL